MRKSLKAPMNADPSPIPAEKASHDRARDRGGLMTRFICGHRRWIGVHRRFQSLSLG
jgi:hypothetical protein